jgi:hypothetical protein
MQSSRDCSNPSLYCWFWSSWGYNNRYLEFNPHEYPILRLVASQHKPLAIEMDVFYKEVYPETFIYL